MTQFKQYGLGALAMAALIFLFRSFFCQLICPPCTPTGSFVPNPIIEFNVPNGKFGVTADSVPGATTVNIEVFSHTGAQVHSFATTPGARQIILDSTAQRPLLLVFSYKDSNGNEVALDKIRIDDRGNGGGPIMEIIVGVHGGAALSCPNFTDTVDVVPGANPAIFKFTWTPGKLYKIRVVHDGTEEFYLSTQSGGDNCYDAYLWRKNKYTCLGMPEMLSLSGSEVQVTTASKNVKITGNDNCDNSSAREIFIRASGNGAGAQVIVLSN